MQNLSRCNIYNTAWSKTPSYTSVIPFNLQTFSERPFSRTTASGCFCYLVGLLYELVVLTTKVTTSTKSLVVFGKGTWNWTIISFYYMHDFFWKHRWWNMNKYTFCYLTAWFNHSQKSLVSCRSFFCSF